MSVMSMSMMCQMFACVSAVFDVSGVCQVFAGASVLYLVSLLCLMSMVCRCSRLSILCLVSLLCLVSARVILCLLSLLCQMFVCTSIVFGISVESDFRVSQCYVWCQCCFRCTRVSVSSVRDKRRNIRFPI